MTHLDRTLFVVLLCGLNLLTPNPSTAEPPGENDAANHQVRLRNWPVDFSPVAHETTDRDIEATAVPSAASHFVTIVPCRVVDTRGSIGSYGGPAFANNETRSFDINDGPCAGIPANASGYSLNVTVVTPAAGGWLTVWPTGGTKPVVSTLNYLSGQTVANAAVVPAGAGGSIDIASIAATHLLVDINGYFVEGVVTAIVMRQGSGLVGGGTGVVQPGLAAGGVGSTEIANDTVVRSVNGLNDAITLAAGANVTMTPSADTLTIAAPGTSANTPNMLVKRDATGSFAAGALTLSGKIEQVSAAGFVVKGTDGSGAIPATGAGQRVMWYPGQSAFRVGWVGGAQWDDASVGLCSVATGFETVASGLYSTALGYQTIASGFGSTAMGRNTTASGSYSTAIGAFASATDLGGTPHSGTFVWGDWSSASPVRATANNQFVARASGGVAFYSNILMTTGVTLAAGGGSWASVSDRGQKHNFAPVEGENILARLAELPVTSWSYRDDSSGRRYIGPVSQDFHALFGLGDETTIATLDVDGITLAALKALETRTDEFNETLGTINARTDSLERENAKLREELQVLVKAVAQMQHK